MPVFSRKPNELDAYTFIRDCIEVEHFEGGLGALNLDLYSYSRPRNMKGWDYDEYCDRLLILSFEDKESFKRAYKMARTIIKKGPQHD